MTPSLEKVSRTLAREKAAKEHMEVCSFLSKKTIRNRLPSIGRVQDTSSEIILFERLLISKQPITAKDTGLKADIGAETTIYEAQGRLNNLLKTFSNEFAVLRNNRVVIAVTSSSTVKRGGTKLGRYFTCQNTVTKDFLDADTIRQLLDKTWQKFRTAKIRSKKREKLKRSEKNKLKAQAISHFSKTLSQRESDNYQFSVMKVGPAKTWQELYHDFAIEPIFANYSDGWLKTVGREVVDEQKNLSEPEKHFVGSTAQAFELSFAGPPMVLKQMIDKHKNILLSGPSGSGKTTAFKLLAASWLREYDPSEKPQLAFYVRLKELESVLEKTPDWKRTIDISELIGLAVVQILRDKCGDNQLVNCETIKLLSRKLADSKSAMSLTREDMLKSIGDEVSAWFKNDAGDNSNTLVLLDGINEMRPQHRDILNNKIETLINRGCHVVLSCRSNLAGSLFSEYNRQFTRFELQELTKDQIIIYLDHHILGKGKQIFESQFQDNPRLFSMAKNPFFLYLMAKTLERDEKAHIPLDRAHLIEGFVSDCIKRKQKDGVYAEEMVRLKDDTVHRVLTYVAKWSIGTLIPRNDNESSTFLSSQEFIEAKTFDETHRALEGAKSYGLLASSGLMDEDTTWGYPNFIHDNIRDYFAAVYLKNMGASSLEQLRELMEFTIWDEPILLFLELCESKYICRGITEFALSHDPVFAALCMRHARILETGLCLRAAHTLAKSPLSNPEQISSLHKKTFEASARKIRCSLPAYSLGRLSACDIIRISQEFEDDIQLQEYIWTSLPETVTSKDWPILKDFWKTLPQILGIRQCYILLATTQIPTQEAFTFLIKAYKNSISWVVPDLGVPVFLGLLYQITYSPSLTEIVSEFSFEASPDEFEALLSKVTKLGDEDIPLLEKLIFSSHSGVVSAASNLLAKILQKKALPTLQRRFDESVAKNKKQKQAFFSLDTFNENNIQNGLTAILEELVPKKKEQSLLDELDAFRSKSTYPANREAPLGLVQTLALIRTPKALKYLVIVACQMDNGVLSGFCADQLETWPNRLEVLTAIKDYGDMTMPTQRLLYAWLDKGECSESITSIFDKLFSLTVLGQKDGPPSCSASKLLYDQNPESWHNVCFDDALATLPLALRAIRKTPSSEIAVKLLRLIEWAYGEIVVREKWNLTQLSFHLLTDCLFTFTTIIRSNNYDNVLNDFTGSPALKDSLRWITEDDYLYKSDSREMLAHALVHFCENVPEHYASKLFSAAYQQFKKTLLEISSVHKIDIEYIFELLVCLSRRSCDSDIADFLQSLTTFSLQLKKKEQIYIGALLAQAIKLAKGRRFLRELAV